MSEGARAVGDVFILVLAGRIVEAVGFGLQFARIRLATKTVPRRKVRILYLASIVFLFNSTNVKVLKAGTERFASPSISLSNQQYFK
jgi:hypothetical protein